MTSTLLTRGALSNPPGFSLKPDNSGLPFRQYLGLPLKTPVQRGLDGYEMTARTLTQTDKAQVSANIQSSIHFTGATHNDFLIQVALPVVKTDQMQQHMTSWSFPVILPPTVPEGGIARLLKSVKNKGHFSIDRYGVGFKMSHAVMNTPEGIEEYNNHIQQLSLCFLEGLKAEALNKITTSGDPTLKQLTSANMLTKEQYSNMVASILDQELRVWGILQQMPNGWAALDTYITIKHDQLNSSDELDTYITDIHCSAFLTTVATDQTNASIYGPNAQANLRTGVQYISTDLRGNSVYYARPNLADDLAPTNYLRSTVSIGEFFRDTDTDCPKENYRSIDRDQMFWNETADNFTIMTLEQKLRGSYRFNSEGLLQNINDLEHASNVTHRGQEELAKDFLHRLNPNTNRAEPLSYFGQMRSEHYPIKTYGDMSTTFFGQLKTLTGKDPSVYSSAIRDLSEIIRIGLSVDVSDQFFGLANDLALLPSKQNNHENGDGFVNDIITNSHGSVDISNATITARRFDFPPFYASYSGLKTLADLPDNPQTYLFVAKKYLDRIRRSLPLFDELADQIHTAFPGCAASSPSLAYPAITNPTHRHVLFDNLVVRTPYRYVFLRPFRNDVMDQFDGGKAYDATYPTIAKLRKAIMKKYIGEWTARDPIGVSIDASGANVANFVWKWVDRTANDVPLARSLGKGDNVPSDLEFGGNDTKNSYDAIAHIGLLVPTNASSNVAKAHALVMLYMLLQKGDGSNMVTKLPGILELNLDTDLGMNFQNKYSDPNQLKALKRRIKGDQAIRSTPDSKSMLETIVNEIDEKANVRTLGTGLRFDPFVGNYKRTPLVIGAVTLRSLIQYAGLGKVGISYSSNSNPSSIISDLERQTAEKPLYSEEDYKIIGNIFRSDYNTSIDNGPYNVENLPFINIAKKKLQRNQSRATPETSLASRSKQTLKRPFSRAQKMLRGYEDADDRAIDAEQERADIAALMYSNPQAHAALDVKSTDQIVDDTFKGNYREIVRHYQDRPAELMVIIAYLFTPITKYNLERIVEQNILFPWDHLCMRPYITWSVADVIKMKAGSSTGNTLMGNILTEIGDDAATQSHTFSVFMYYGAVIKNPQNIMRVSGALVLGYISGGDDEIIDPKYHAPSEGLFGRNPSSSFIIAAIPRTEVTRTNALSTTGEVVYNDRQGDVIASDVRVRVSGYSTAPFQDALYNLSGQDFNNPNATKLRFINSTHKYLKDFPTPNCIVMKSRALYRDNNKEFTIASSQTGHWKNHYVVPGAGAARVGRSALPAPVTYTQTKVF